MKYILEKAEDKKSFNTFLASVDHSVFQQSWEWGTLYETKGKQCYRFVIRNEETIIAAATAIRIPLFLGKSYFLLPRGPVFASHLSLDEKEECLKLLLGALRSEAYESKTTKEVFVRLEPNEDCVSEVSLRRTIDHEPSREYATNLFLPFETILEKSHKKLVYNMRLAEKKGIEIIESQDIDAFIQLLQNTAQRHAIRLHDIEHYKSLFSLKGEVKAFLHFARWEGKNVAAVLMLCFGDTAYYVHGGSNYEHRQLMAPHLLHFKLIQHYKSLGYHYYNFGGVSPLDNVQHPLAQVSDFKRKYAGEEKQWPGTYDFIFDSGFYDVYRIVRKLRRILGKIFHK